MPVLIPRVGPGTDPRRTWLLLSALSATVSALIFSPPRPRRAPPASPYRAARAPPSMPERASHRVGARQGGVLEQVRDSIDTLGEADHQGEMYRAQLVLALTAIARAVDHLYDELGL